MPFKALPNIEPAFYFVSKDYKLLEKYEKSPSLNDIFKVSGNGIVTKRDRLCIHDNPAKCFLAAEDILLLEKQSFYSKYQLPNDVRDWKYDWAKEDIEIHGLSRERVREISYRPFDSKYIYYTGQSRGFVGWPVQKVMSHYVNGENIGLLAPKAFNDAKFNHAFITKNISEAIFLSSLSGSNAMNFPLYLYSEDGREKISNINQNIIDEFSARITLPYLEKQDESNSYFSSLDIFLYIYAVLHSPWYRETYNEPLKTSYPRIPFPKSKETFFQLAEQGNQLRHLHLMEAEALENFISAFPMTGSNEVTHKINSKDWELYDKNKQLGRIWINKDQYFEGIPLKVWEFYIGGYQPAQKWLKDRSGRQLSFEDILHYQKIIVALNETDRIMQDIDGIELE